MTRLQLLLLGALSAALAACSALLHEDAQQCANNGDCAALGFEGWTCDTKAKVCIADQEPVGGSGPTAGNAGNPSAGHPGAGSVSGGSSSGGDGGSGGNGGNSSGGKAGGGAGGVGGSSAGMAGASGSGGNGGSGGSGPPPCNNTACAAANGSCQAGVCVIECNAPDCAPKCPFGMPCRVDCGDNSCNGGLVDCTKASSCDISCGASSCFQGIDCAGSACSIGCKGDKSCSNIPVLCRAKNCDIDCGGLQTCKEIKCLNSPSTCDVTCGGVQSCGTSFQTTAAKTTFACTAPDSCAAAINICCSGGAKCGGSYAPQCF
jgi:hypothetical protein